MAKNKEYVCPVCGEIYKDEFDAMDCCFNESDLEFTDNELENDD